MTESDGTIEFSCEGDGSLDKDGRLDVVHKKMSQVLGLSWNPDPGWSGIECDGTKNRECLIFVRKGDRGKKWDICGESGFEDGGSVKRIGWRPNRE